MRRTALAITIGVTLLAGCGRDPAGVDVTPSVQELTDKIIAANGRVFIGFKEAKAGRGVDKQGRVLVSEETQARARTFLSEQGITVDYMYHGLPGIAGHMTATPELVARLVAHPNIDYLEPIVGGTRFDGRGPALQSSGGPFHSSWQHRLAAQHR